MTVDLEQGRAVLRDLGSHHDVDAKLRWLFEIERKRLLHLVRENEKLRQEGLGMYDAVELLEKLDREERGR